MTHRVVGTSKERPGITDGATLKRWLYTAFMLGSMVEVPSLSAARAAVHRSRSPPARSGRPSGQRKAALAAWMREGSHESAGFHACPKHSRRFRHL